MVIGEDDNALKQVKIRLENNVYRVAGVRIDMANKQIKLQNRRVGKY